MGCINSKPKTASQSHKEQQLGEIKNPLSNSSALSDLNSQDKAKDVVLENVTLFFDRLKDIEEDTINVSSNLFSDDEKKIINIKKKHSLLNCPSSEDLLYKIWINKRGHFIRTWKRRFCVLDKSELKYYLDEDSQPPYGRVMKGKVALLGAVIVKNLSQDNKVIEVEIYGNQGEKDLFFYIEDNYEGQEFLRILEWSIRRTTTTMLLRYFKTSVPSHFTNGLVVQSINDLQDERDEATCFEWQRQQDVVLNEVLNRLKNPRLFYLITPDNHGSINLVPAIIGLQMKEDLKNIIDNNKDLEENNLNNLNLVYQILTEKNIKLNPSDNSINYFFYNDINEDNFHNMNTFLEPPKLLHLDDLEDLSYYYLDERTTDSIRNLLKLHSNYFFHFYSDKNKEDNYFPLLSMTTSQSYPTSINDNLNLNSNFFNKKNFLIYILKFKSFENPIYMISCSIFDYQNLFFDIQNLILIQNFKKKLKQSSSSYKREKLNKGCIAHSSVLQAMNLLD